MRYQVEIGDDPTQAMLNIYLVGSAETSNRSQYRTEIAWPIRSELNAG